MTISDALRYGLSELKEASFLLDLEVSLASLYGKERDFLILNRDLELSNDLAVKFEEYVQRLKKGEPLAYIIQKKEFYGLEFYVDKRVLIPRPETEILVGEAFDFIAHREFESLNIVDLGAGSGNISISLCKQVLDKNPVKSLKISAVDISEEALNVLKINVAKHDVSKYVFPFNGDLFEFEEVEKDYDLILANLPYIGTEKYNFVEKRVKEFEPNIALFGGFDGLVLYRKMFEQMKEKEITFKFLIGEFGFMQMGDLMELLNKYFAHRKVSIIKDYSGIDRFFIVI